MVMIGAKCSKCCRGCNDSVLAMIPQMRATWNVTQAGGAIWGNDGYSEATSKRVIFTESGAACAREFFETDSGAFFDSSGSAVLLPNGNDYLTATVNRYHVPAGQTSGNTYGNREVFRTTGISNTTKLKLVFLCGTETQLSVPDGMRYIWASMGADVLLGSGTKSRTIYPGDWPANGQRVPLKSGANYATNSQNILLNQAEGGGLFFTPRTLLTTGVTFVTPNAVTWSGSRPSELVWRIDSGPSAGTTYSIALDRWVEEGETVMTVEYLRQQTDGVAPVQRWARFATPAVLVGEVVNDEPRVYTPFTLSHNQFQVWRFSGYHTFFVSTTYRTETNTRIPYNVFGTTLGDVQGSNYVPSSRIKQSADRSALVFGGTCQSNAFFGESYIAGDFRGTENNQRALLDTYSGPTFTATVDVE